LVARRAVGRGVKNVSAECPERNLEERKLRWGAVKKDQVFR